jgi:hypothetical protein
VNLNRDLVLSPWGTILCKGINWHKVGITIFGDVSKACCGEVFVLLVPRHALVVTERHECCSYTTISGQFISEICRGGTP